MAKVRDNASLSLEYTLLATRCEERRLLRSVARAATKHAIVESTELRMRKFESALGGSKPCKLYSMLTYYEKSLFLIFSRKRVARCFSEFCVKVGTGAIILTG